MRLNRKVLSQLALLVLVYCPGFLASDGQNKDVPPPYSPDDSRPGYSDPSENEKMKVVEGKLAPLKIADIPYGVKLPANLPNIDHGETPEKRAKRISDSFMGAYHRLKKEMMGKHSDLPGDSEPNIPMITIAITEVPELIASIDNEDLDSIEALVKGMAAMVNEGVSLTPVLDEITEWSPAVAIPRHLSSNYLLRLFHKIEERKNTSDLGLKLFQEMILYPDLAVRIKRMELKDLSKIGLWVKLVEVTYAGSKVRYDINEEAEKRFHEAMKLLEEMGTYGGEAKDQGNRRFPPQRSGRSNGRDLFERAKVNADATFFEEEEEEQKVDMESLDGLPKSQKLMKLVEANRIKTVYAFQKEFKELLTLELLRDVLVLSAENDRLLGKVLRFYQDTFVTGVPLARENVREDENLACEAAEECRHVGPLLQLLRSLDPILREKVVDILFKSDKVPTEQKGRLMATLLKTKFYDKTLGWMKVYNKPHLKDVYDYVMGYARRTDQPDLLYRASLYRSPRNRPLNDVTKGIEPSQKLAQIMRLTNKPEMHKAILCLAEDGPVNLREIEREYQRPVTLEDIFKAIKLAEHETDKLVQHLMFTYIKGVENGLVGHSKPPEGLPEKFDSQSYPNSVQHLRGMVRELFIRISREKNIDVNRFLELLVQLTLLPKTSILTKEQRSALHLSLLVSPSLNNNRRLVGDLGSSGLCSSLERLVEAPKVIRKRVAKAVFDSDDVDEWNMVEVFIAAMKGNVIEDTESLLDYGAEPYLDEITVKSSDEKVLNLVNETRKLLEEQYNQKLVDSYIEAIKKKQFKDAQSLVEHANVTRKQSAPSLLIRIAKECADDGVQQLVRDALKLMGRETEFEDELGEAHEKEKMEKFVAVPENDKEEKVVNEDAGRGRENDEKVDSIVDVQGLAKHETNDETNNKTISRSGSLFSLIEADSIQTIGDYQREIKENLSLEILQEAIVKSADDEELLSKVIGLYEDTIVSDVPLVAVWENKNLVCGTPHQCRHIGPLLALLRSLESPLKEKILSSLLSNKVISIEERAKLLATLVKTRLLTEPGQKSKFFGLFTNEDFTAAKELIAKVGQQGLWMTLGLIQYQTGKPLLEATKGMPSAFKRLFLTQLPKEAFKDVLECLLTDGPIDDLAQFEKQFNRKVSYDDLARAMAITKNERSFGNIVKTLMNAAEKGYFTDRNDQVEPYPCSERVDLVRKLLKRLYFRFARPIGLALLRLVEFTLGLREPVLDDEQISALHFTLLTSPPLLRIQAVMQSLINRPEKLYANLQLLGGVPKHIRAQIADTLFDLEEERFDEDEDRVEALIPAIQGQVFADASDLMKHATESHLKEIVKRSTDEKVQQLVREALGLLHFQEEGPGESEAVEMADAEPGSTNESQEQLTEGRGKVVRAKTAPAWLEGEHRRKRLLEPEEQEMPRPLVIPPTEKPFVIPPTEKPRMVIPPTEGPAVIPPVEVSPLQQVAQVSASQAIPSAGPFPVPKLTAVRKIGTAAGPIIVGPTIYTGPLIKQQPVPKTQTVPRVIAGKIFTSSGSSGSSSGKPRLHQYRPVTVHTFKPVPVVPRLQELRQRQVERARRIAHIATFAVIVGFSLLGYAMYCLAGYDRSVY